MSEEQLQSKHYSQNKQLQQSQQLDQQALNNKVGKECTPPGNAAPMTNSAVSTTSSPPITNKKSNIHEMRNQDYINRLMAATPPYLYSASVGNNFFFSDMLRALVQARQNENMRHLQLQQQHQQHQQHQQQQQQQAALLARRSRKRLWSQHRPYFDNLRESKEIDEKQQHQHQEHQQQQQPNINSGNIVKPTSTPEKPLELTNKAYFHLANAYQRKVQLETIREFENVKTNVMQEEKNISEDEQKQHARTTTEVCKEIEISDTAGASQTHVSALTGGGAAAESVLQETPPAASLPPQDLVLPPPPPVWYPPMYPPYVFDPLHFFIDLRVSGHIYDRKKENVSPLSNNTENQHTNNNTAQVIEADSLATAAALNLPNKHRHGSAFTVPTPRSNESKNMPATNAALTSDALNLSATASKFYDLTESKENNHPLTKHNANYMLQQLPRLYSQFAARDFLHNSLPVHRSTDIDGVSSQHNDNVSSTADNRSDCDGGESDELTLDNVSNRDIDVEIIDSIKYRTDADSSHCSSPDDTSITQID